MVTDKPRVTPFYSGLSARLLILTIFFVMLSEVLIYAPSIGRYRLVYLQDRIAMAHLASLGVTAPGEGQVSQELLKELLDHARAHGIVLRRPASKALILATDMPPRIDATFDLRKTSFFGLIGQAFIALARNDNRAIRVIGVPPRSSDVIVEAVIDEAPMRAEMIDFSERILALSVAISLITASLVYLSLQWLFVRPMLAVTESMISFRRNPEDARHLMVPSGRRDEIGDAQHELAEMQQGLRQALQQKARLAALGTAVTKINHDLRNILATAQLVSDHLATTDDPNVKRIAPTLLSAIDRAIKLCSHTLGFVQTGTPSAEMTRFTLDGLVAEIDADLVANTARQVTLRNLVDHGFDLFADRDQMYRVLSNLILNAFEAGADIITVRAGTADDMVEITVADDGPGLPPKVIDNLFQPFSGSVRAGGTGLGLAIARDLLRGHGGDIVLVRTGEEGTVFRLCLPVEEGARKTPPRPPQRTAALR
jgi:signal transduction histidine kinase